MSGRSPRVQQTILLGPAATIPQVPEPIDTSCGEAGPPGNTPWNVPAGLKYSTRLLAVSAT
jgi:hypothetical protein